MFGKMMSGSLTLLIFAICSIAFAPFAANAQTAAELVETADTRYYDFWPGTWAEVVDGKPDMNATIFTVERSVNPASYLEKWIQVYEGKSHLSLGIRAWDQVNNRWMFTWISDNALYQIWTGKKIDGDWFIQKEFEVDGERLLSRQAWIPVSENRLTRTIERSFDDGKTWTSRFSQTFEKVE